MFEYSQLSAVTVGHLATTHYTLDKPLQSKFYARGLHDNYLISSAEDKYILRVYRNTWRSEEQVLFELELLDFLRRRHAPVASPVRTKSGEFMFRVECPEGTRHGALFHFSRGHAPTQALSVEESALLGQAVAQVHLAAATFTTQHSRTELDLPYLLDDSLLSIASFMDNRAQNYLNRLQEKLHKHLPPLTRDRDLYGICIGDVNSTNFHIDENRHITLFDFDQCGYGYLAFDIAKFFASLHTRDTKAELTEAFLRGYQQIRQLSRTELDAIAYFEIVAVIWVMAINADNAEFVGHKWLDKSYWEKRLERIRQMEASIKSW